MAILKKLVMHGFKSFPRKTEIPFDNGINVILGPNGSGKSNISDALCFVLGRLSIKSIRAKKAANLIFMGTKAASPSKEAIVEIVFSNDDKTFTIDSSEVSIKRIVRKNGQSIYKINNETKTRQEVLTLLAQAGIDPHGFNIILQGEIQNFVRMKPDERRGIIEEVSGIAIYESRKEKSLKELNKTEERLKEVAAILRERTSYLNNLEKERQEALRFKKLESSVKIFKASIISSDISKKKKEVDLLQQEITKLVGQIEKIKITLTKTQSEIENSRLKVASINSKIEKSSGIEQEMLNREIADIRAELAGLNVKIENYESKISQIEKQKQDLEDKTIEHEQTLLDLRKEAPLAKKELDLEKKKKEFEQLEDQRKKFYMIKSELKSNKERLREKEQSLQDTKNESELSLRQIDSMISELFDKKTTKEKLISLKKTLSEKREILDKLNIREREIEKENYNSEHEIANLQKLTKDISKIDTCPLCKSKITSEHISSIKNETSPKIKDLGILISKHDKELNELYTKRDLLKEDVAKISSEISKRESDLNRLLIINEKNERIKTLQESIDKKIVEINSLRKRQSNLEKSFDDYSNIENKYETVRAELQEISLRSEETIDSEMSYKQRELERMKSNLKQLSSDESDFNEELESLKQESDEKQSSLDEKNDREQDLIQRNQKLISERDSIQKEIRENETQLIHKQNEIHNIEQKNNELKIEKARHDAELENLEVEMLSFSNIQIIKLKKEELLEKLQKTQETLSRIGSVNLRSLEVYDQVKKEYDSVRERAELIDSEKSGILKIIHEIDIKKKKAFNTTLHALNEIFSRNFSQLSTKGHVTLEIENKKDPFENDSGVQIIVKTGHGKYFDVTSLSGGEQTLVALSLIFAIQEYSPYHFYILDEIDAALDKRNSERLGGLLKKYMQKGQYIVITHNDEIITNASNLYGVSMHEGISKIVSLKI